MYRVIQITLVSSHMLNLTCCNFLWKRGLIYNICATAWFGKMFIINVSRTDKCLMAQNLIFFTIFCHFVSNKKSIFFEEIYRVIIFFNLSEISCFVIDKKEFLCLICTNILEVISHNVRRIPFYIFSPT